MLSRTRSGTVLQVSLTLADHKHMNQNSSSKGIVTTNELHTKIARSRTLTGRGQPLSAATELLNFPQTR